MGPGALSEVLSQLPKTSDPRLLIGLDTADDAGVFQLDSATALIQTVDFFTPLVDDPYLFGQIAAANSLSDVYAMGGKPLTAMNIVAFPMCSLDASVLGEILKGGQEKIIESGAVLVGGHTIDDAEPKYGLSVTGLVHPSKVWANAGARPGDLLIVTKPIGTGVLATAMRAEMFADGMKAAIASMAMLNKVAAETARAFSVHACTDITGFGILGHLFEMAAASGVRVEVDSQAIPLLPEAADAAAMGFVPGGAYSNREYLSQVTFQADVPENIRDLCYDPQTSGGLLFSLPEGEAKAALAALKNAGLNSCAIIGRVVEPGRGEIYVY